MRERAKERKIEREREKEGDRRIDSMEEEDSGRQERNSDTLFRETEGIIK